MKDTTVKKYMLAKDYTFKGDNSSINVSSFGFPDYLYRTFTIDNYKNLEKDFYNLNSEFYISKR